MYKRYYTALKRRCKSHALDYKRSNVKMNKSADSLGNQAVYFFKEVL